MVVDYHIKLIFSMEMDVHIDKLDKRILEILIADARTPYLEIARACNVSGATVHLRIQKLEKMGIIEGSYLKVNSKKLGMSLCVFLGIHLDKCHNLDSISDKLQEIPEVVECHYTTGEYAIFIKMYCENTAHLRQILMDKIQPIPNITRTETFISLKETFKREPSIKNNSSSLTLENS